MLAMPLGVLQFIPVYHVLHDLSHIHSEVCCLIVLAFYGLIVWAADRHPSEEARSQPNKGANISFLPYVIFLGQLVV